MEGIWKLFLQKPKFYSRKGFLSTNEKDKKQLIKRDFDKGFDLFLSNDEVKSRKDDIMGDVLHSMYV